MDNTKSEPQCKLRTLGDADMSVEGHRSGAGTTVREAVPVWGTLHFPLNFAVNPKLLSIIQSILSHLPGDCDSGGLWGLG